MKDQQEKQVFLDSLKEFPVVKIAAKKSGISRAQIYRWIKENKDFKVQFKEAMKEGVKNINDECENNLITMITQSELGAMKFWLQHHHEDYSKSGYIPVIYSKK